MAGVEPARTSVRRFLRALRLPVFATSARIVPVWRPSGRPLRKTASTCLSKGLSLMTPQGCGGACRVRTGDLLLAKQALFQLS